MARDKRIVDNDTPDGSQSGQRKRVKYTAEDAHRAKIYGELASEVQATRIQAATDLLKNLTAETSDQRSKLDEGQVRLVKGLCSGRKAARLGFSIAFTELCRLRFSNFNGQTAEFDRPLQAILTYTDLTGKKGQELRDAYLGRLFGLVAVLKSDVGLNQQLTTSVWEEHFKAMFGMLEPRWVSRDFGSMLYGYLTSDGGLKLETARVQTIVDVAHKKRAEFFKQPEGVGIWIAITQGWPDIQWPKGVWHHDNPLSSKERSKLGSVMLENATSDFDRKTLSGSRQVTPSFAWNLVLSKLFGTSKPKRFSQFWDEVVAGGMFSRKASTERRSLGLQIFSLAVQIAPSARLIEVLHPKILRCILDQRAERDRYLFSAAKASLLHLSGRAKQGTDTAPYLIVGLLKNGDINFDQATKTKTIETMLQPMNPVQLNEVVCEITGLLKALMTEQQDGAENRCRILVDLLLSTVRQHKHQMVQADSDNASTLHTWVREILTTLCQCSYDQVEPAFSFLAPSRSICRSRLNSCLTCIMDGPVQQAVLAAGFAARFVLSHYATATEPDSEPDELLRKAQTSIEETVNAEGAGSAAFALLLSLSVIRRYNEEPDATSALEDLITCYESRGDQRDSGVMLIELLLSFISKPLSLYKKIAEQAFTAFASDLTAEGLQSLTDILGQKESLSGQQELFDENGVDETGDMMVEDELGMDGEDASDVEIVDNQAVSSFEPDQESDGESESETEGEADVVVEDEEAIFDKKLAEALGTAGMEDAEGSDEDMDDDQMMALEPHLANIFKQRQEATSKKREKKDARDTMVTFKSRVLDMLTIYVKSQCGNILALDLILPLVVLVRTTRSSVLNQKAFEVLKQYFDACTKQKMYPQARSGNTDSTPALFQLLAALHDEMRLGSSKLHANACSRSSLFLSKVLVGADKVHYGRIAGMYAQLQTEWYLDTKNGMQSNVFTEWTSWSIATRKGLGSVKGG